MPHYSTTQPSHDELRVGRPTILRRCQRTWSNDHSVTDNRLLSSPSLWISASSRRIPEAGSTTFSSKWSTMQSTFEACLRRDREDDATAVRSQMMWFVVWSVDCDENAVATRQRPLSPRTALHVRHLHSSPSVSAVGSKLVQKLHSDLCRQRYRRR